MKKAILVHGWGGSPKSDWIPWLKSELENKVFEVITPKMPNTDKPVIKEWVGHLQKIIKNPDKNTILVGHSIGCQTILRYLESLPDNAKVGGVLLVAGFVNLKNLDPEEDKEIAKPWLTIPINFDKIKKRAEKIIALFSTDDPYVNISDSKIFKEKLGAKIIIEKNKGHFNEPEYPEILSEVLNL